MMMTGSGFPQRLCPISLTAKYIARNSLAYMDIFDCEGKMFWNRMQLGHRFCVLT